MSKQRALAGSEDVLVVFSAGRTTRYEMRSPLTACQQQTFSILQCHRNGGIVKVFARVDLL